MKLPLFRRPRPDPRITALYGAIVAQARIATFYQDYGIPDTVNGRFDMIVLHLALLLRRLESEPELSTTLGQAVFDTFCRDMDDNLREMGVSDIKVPREMRRIGEAFYGRVAAYRTALLDNDEAALTAAIARNLYDGEGTGARRMARYMQHALGRLQAQAGIAEGQVVWPDPALISA